MDKYYYTIAQLPTLYFDREPEITIESFFAEARKWLTPGDYRALEKLDIDDTVTGARDAVLRRYKRFEDALRRDLAGWRRARISGGEAALPAYLSAIVKEGDPLEVEKKLLHLRWRFIEEMEREHHFDFSVLLLYLLKLQILKRLSSFDSEKGLAVFKKICEVSL